MIQNQGTTLLDYTIHGIWIGKRKEGTFI